ncbi:DUF805 domain-containing protein [Pseudomonas sp. DTU_2021_1001937_2_SI_NGA_ILE_001]|uniref:DUF805 domain-containing protein n=1 Tax=Pseudomonas sp. DTU_2021_1001937_2_SI_NGA_ILE_001 TaxID=3077589 RepID=UPI0025CD713A|nr:DUF805 domain-containing protein [Pseudomonas sp. DTU_2021_1001937_2_SI_NGA_ILE_001]WNW14053.1 DUF805 domain-containing protein [Pseudomonas sp. DTU_2021_1001937_2_SI_NGA_ILE_001]
MKVLLHIYKNTLNFEGRASRREAVYYLIHMLLIVGVLVWMDFHFNLIDPDWGIGPCTGIFSMLIFLTNLSFTIRRLHDTDLSGWWFLINYVPLVGPFISLWLMLQAGTPGDNRFGPPPARI